MIDPNVLVVCFLVMGTLAFGLYRIPHRECPECPHCQAFIRDREMKAHDKFHRYYNVPKPHADCKRCKGGME